MKSDLKQLRWELWLFGKFKIPAIGFVRPSIAELSNSKIDIRIPLRRRTRNHVGSMYLGVMTVGADLASGFLAYYIAKSKRIKVAPVFKSMHAEYFKRAEADVHFVCSQGQEIEEMLQEMQDTKERVNRPIVVEAHCNKELVAQFTMELSMKSK